MRTAIQTDRSIWSPAGGLPGLPAFERDFAAIWGLRGGRVGSTWWNRLILRAAVRNSRLASVLAQGREHQSDKGPENSGAALVFLDCWVRYRALVGG
jgi:hypothetical protein